jgi:hypothetical protein
MSRDALQPSRECKVCLNAHDDEIHEATLSIHRWFRQEVTKYLYDSEDVPSEQVA